MATLAAEPPHGLVPAFNVKPNGLADGASREIADTFNAAVPVLRIVTSKGAGTLLVVTWPKSKDEGRTCTAGAAGGAGADLGSNRRPRPRTQQPQWWLRQKAIALMTKLPYS